MNTLLNGSRTTICPIRNSMSNIRLFVDKQRYKKSKQWLQLNTQLSGKNTGHAGTMKDDIHPMRKSNSQSAFQYTVVKRKSDTKNPNNGSS